MRKKRNHRHGKHLPFSTFFVILVSSQDSESDFIMPWAVKSSLKLDYISLSRYHSCCLTFELLISEFGAGRKADGYVRLLKTSNTVSGRTWYVRI